MLLSPEYLAGLFDGEGSVEITNKYALRLRITNTFTPLITALKAQFGGSIHKVQPGKSLKKHWRVAHSWQASGEIARTFLSLVFPFLIIKREQARIGLEIHPFRRGVKIPQQERERRGQLKIQISLLNKRGTRWSEPYHPPLALAA